MIWFGDGTLKVNMLFKKIRAPPEVSFSNNLKIFVMKRKSSLKILFLHLA